MKVKEIQAIIPPSARVRIKSGEGILGTGYNAVLPGYGERDVLKLVFATDVCHRDYKTKGLLPPVEPDIPASFSVNGLSYRIYYDIYIQ